MERQGPGKSKESQRRPNMEDVHRFLQHPQMVPKPSIQLRHPRHQWPTGLHPLLLWLLPSFYSAS
ncbi:hypothetical protein LINGRAHAP2_LOCUS24705 [Linum grandiflorum]